MMNEDELKPCPDAVKIMLVEDQKADAMLIKRALLKGGNCKTMSENHQHRP